MQLWSQLQRIEARQIHFHGDMKVFNANLLKFLHFTFSAAASFFVQPSAMPPQPNVSAAAQPSATSSARAGATEEVHFSSDDENDVFDWQSPRDHLQPLGPITTTPAPAILILSAAPTPTTSAVAERPTPDSPAKRKGKATSGRTFGRDIPSSLEDEGYCVRSSQTVLPSRKVSLFHSAAKKMQLNFVLRGRYPCDNGYKEVTVLPSRDIVYDQVKQLI
ncbi:hypothetical protein GQ457_13G014440 [Hibiscus cannabinus]